MTLPDLSPERAPQQLLTDITAYIEQANASVAARDTVALAGLDTVVDTLCERIVAFDPESAKQYAGELVQVMERLNQLQQALVAQQNEVVGTIRALNSTKKATSAYEKNQPEA